MGKEKLVSYKLQSYLALIPYFGLPIVLFTSFYNIFKIQHKMYIIGIYYLLTLIPLFISMLLGVFIVKLFIMGKNPTIMIILYLLLSFILLLFVAIVCVGIEKRMIEKLKKTREKQFENNMY